MVGFVVDGHSSSHFQWDRKSVQCAVGYSSCHMPLKVMYHARKYNNKTGSHSIIRAIII